MSTIFTTIQLMKFFLCTTYGDFATFYGGGLSQYPFQGVCQGNRAGLAIWLALSLRLIQIIHWFGLPNKISSAIPLASIILVGLIYIDDCDLFVLAHPPVLTPRLFYSNYNKTWISGRAVLNPQEAPFPGKILLEQTALPFQSWTMETPLISVLSSYTLYQGWPTRSSPQAMCTT